MIECTIYSPRRAYDGPIYDLWAYIDGISSAFLEDAKDTCFMLTPNKSRTVIEAEQSRRQGPASDLLRRRCIVIRESQIPAAEASKETDHWSEMQTIVVAQLVREFETF